MCRLLFGSSVIVATCSFVLLAAAGGTHFVSDMDAAALFGGGLCQYTTVPGLHCGNKDIQPVACVDTPGNSTTDGGSSRRAYKFCSNNGTDVCGTVYNAWDCGTSP